MSRHETYTQCRLQRLTEEGIQEMVSWLPTDIAKKGAVVRLKGWTDGWKVVEVWATKRGDVVEAAVPDHRHHRKRTDI